MAVVERAGRRSFNGRSTGRHIMQLSIYSRAMALIGASLAAVTIAMTFVTLREKEAVLTNELLTRLGMLADHGAASVRDAVLTLNRANAQAILQDLGRDPDFLFAEVSDDQGRSFVRLGAESDDAHLVEERQAPIVVGSGQTPQTVGRLSVVFSLERLQ